MPWIGATIKPRRNNDRATRSPCLDQLTSPDNPLVEFLFRTRGRRAQPCLRRTMGSAPFADAAHNRSLRSIRHPITLWRHCMNIHGISLSLRSTDLHSMTIPGPSMTHAAHPNAAAPDYDVHHFRRALGQFATGVTIITTKSPDGQPIGFTASSFNSVSLDPPLVLWSLDANAGSLPAFRGNSHYAINVLASDQIEWSRRFGAKPGAIPSNRFEGVGWREGSGGAPVLLGCCAWFECFNRSRYAEGDHIIFVGEVERCGFEPREPLIFQDGQYHMTQPHPGRG